MLSEPGNAGKRENLHSLADNVVSLGFWPGLKLRSSSPEQNVCAWFFTAPKVSFSY